MTLFELDRMVRPTGMYVYWGLITAFAFLLGRYVVTLRSQVAGKQVVNFSLQAKHGKVLTFYRLE